MSNGNDPTYVTSVEVARAMIRGNAGDVESPISAREQRRLQQRIAKRAAKKAKRT